VLRQRLREPAAGRWFRTLTVLDLYTRESRHSSPIDHSLA
jgi:hypothetical protein